MNEADILAGRAKSVSALLYNVIIEATPIKSFVKNVKYLVKSVIFCNCAYLLFFRPSSYA
jgi:hypothetical protein